MDQYSKVLEDFEQVDSLGHVGMLHHKVFAVTFHLGRYCNYDCSYCWVFAHSHVKDHRPTEVVIATIAEIKRQARANGFTGFTLTLSGGEPTLHKGFLAIVGALSDDAPNCTWQHLHVTTNLSAGLPWWHQFVEAGRNISMVSITASWHPEAATDRAKHRQEFADKCVFLMDHVICFTNIVMVPALWDTLYEDAEYFNSRGMNVCLKPQSDLHCNHIVAGYTPAMMEAIRNNFVDHQPTLKRPTPRLITPPTPLMCDERGQIIAVIELGLKDGSMIYLDDCERIQIGGFKAFTGWQCTAGFQSIVVKDKGVMYRGMTCHDTPLGSIDDGFELFSEPKACITDRCRASFDLKIPKHR